MKNLFCSAVLLLAGLTGPILSAQTFTYVVSGVVVPCIPGDSVQLELLFFQQPPIDTVVVVDPGTCMFTTTFLTTDIYPTVLASHACNGTVAYAADSTLFSLPDQVLAFDTLILDCGGVPYDCLGIPYGTSVPGTPCNDGNPTTSNDLFTASCACMGDTTNLYDCLNILSGPNMPGTPCDDLDSLNTNDTWALDCTCHGEPFEFDCNGVQNGPAMPGTLCDDGDPLTVGDVWSAACNCAGYPVTPCTINFQVAQAMAYDTATGTSSPILNTLWANFQSNGQWPFQYLWDFGDGSTSTDPYPIHTYAGNGPYDLCATITDWIGCSSTTCDSVSVDANGLIVGMALQGGGHPIALHQRSGFTIMILNELPTSVAELPASGTFELWPNPASDHLNVRLCAKVPEAVKIRIIDINGRVILEQRSGIGFGIDTITLSIEDLPIGIYLLHLEDASGSWSKRFVKVN